MAWVQSTWFSGNKLAARWGNEFEWIFIHAYSPAAFLSNEPSKQVSFYARYRNFVAISTLCNFQFAFSITDRLNETDETAKSRRKNCDEQLWKLCRSKKWCFRRWKIHSSVSVWLKCVPRLSSGWKLNYKALKSFQRKAQSRRQTFMTKVITIDSTSSRCKLDSRGWLLEVWRKAIFAFGIFPAMPLQEISFCGLKTQTNFCNARGKIASGQSMNFYIDSTALEHNIELGKQ